MSTPTTLEERAGSRPAAGPVRHLWELAKQALLWPFYKLYERRLEAEMKDWTLPQHIGVIMDGNRRYARALGSPEVSLGHRAGADKLQQVLSWCYEAGIPVVTVWSFSLDNFHRDTDEVGALLQLFEDRTRELAEHSEVHTNEVRVRYIGKTELLPDGLRQAIRAVEEATAGYDRFHLNIAMAYGGREEITDAFRRFLQQQWRLPPRDAVRIEELVNYFDYDYTGPTDEHPFAVNAEVTPGAPGTAWCASASRAGA